MHGEQDLIRREVVLGYTRYLREYSRELRERATVTRDRADRENSYGRFLQTRTAQLQVEVSGVIARRTPVRPAL